MKIEQVEEYNDLRIGDHVTHIEDSGFKEGVPQRKRIASIKIIEWNEEEQRRLQESKISTYFRFTDGTIASSFHRVQKRAIEKCYSCGKLSFNLGNCPKCGKTFCHDCVPRFTPLRQDDKCCSRFVKEV
jgi:hypothetical protein